MVHTMCETHTVYVFLHTSSMPFQSPGSPAQTPPEHRGVVGISGLTADDGFGL